MAKTNTAAETNEFFKPDYFKVPDFGQFQADFSRWVADALPHAVVTTLALLLALVLGPLTGAARADGWRWPLDGSPTVARGFDPPAERWAAGHRGVDLRGRPGTVVRAAGAGVVGYAGVLAGRGVVAVHHPGGLETTYEPLRITVRVGDAVEPGDVLGRLTTGHGDCGLGWACLHWGLRRGEAYLDPRSLVGAGPVRLLPLDGPVALPLRVATQPPAATADVPRHPPRAATATHRPAAVPTRPLGDRTPLATAALTAASLLGAGAAVSRTRLSARRRGAAR